MAWDAAGNTYITDGYINSRIAKVDKDGNWIKSWGEPGTGPGQFNTPHGIANDAAGNIYVADRGNKRIQVFDNNGTLKTAFTNVGNAQALCMTTEDFARAFHAFANKQKPKFEGN